MTIRVGQAGRASTSARLGAADPRLRRNAQQNTNDRDIAPPLFIDKNGKLNLALSPFLRIENGQVALDTDALSKFVGSLCEGPIVFEKGKIRLESAGSIENLDPTSSPTLSVVTAKLIELIDLLQAGDFVEG